MSLHQLAASPAALRPAQPQPSPPALLTSLSARTLEVGTLPSILSALAPTHTHAHAHPTRPPHTPFAIGLPSKCPTLSLRPCLFTVCCMSARATHCPASVHSKQIARLLCGVAFESTVRRVRRRCRICSDPSSVLWGLWHPADPWPRLSRQRPPPLPPFPPPVPGRSERAPPCTPTCLPPQCCSTHMPGGSSMRYAAFTTTACHLMQHQTAYRLPPISPTAGYRLRCPKFLCVAVA